MATSLTRCVSLGAVALTVVLFADPLPGQQPLEMPRLLDPARLGTAQFRIYSGRVVMGGVRFPQYSTTSTGGGRTERLTLGTNNGEPTLSYESSNAREQLSIEAIGRQRLVIRRKPKQSDGPTSVEFEQLAEAPLLLQIGPPASPQLYRGESLWHLLLAHRDVCRQHLLPLLKILHRDWDLGKTADQVEGALLSAATASELPDRKRWSRLVDQLGEPRFSQREAADRQLREMGRAVVTYLRQLDTSRLDAEQRYRVRRIILSLSTSEDVQSPEQVAAWLSGDPAVWLMLLAREDESVRRLALARLQALVDRPVEFHPAADVETRRRQLEALHTTFAR